MRVAVSNEMIKILLSLKRHAQERHKTTERTNTTDKEMPPARTVLVNIATKVSSIGKVRIILRADLSIVRKT